MIDLSDFLPRPTLAVFPVLVGPLQTLLALLPAILIGAGSMVFAVFKPGGFVRLVRFCWRQKLFFGAIAAVVVAWQYTAPTRWLQGRVVRGHADNIDAGTTWDSIRGGPLRSGRGPGDFDPTAAGGIWNNTRDGCILSSPAICGDRVIFSTATGIGPFSPEGHGAIACVDAHSGREIWRHSPTDYRATFSSPVVAGNVVICGEGLHQVEDARITCLDVRTGELHWEFRTKSHVESTAAIADDRVYIGAGADGFYCLSLTPDDTGKPVVVWHLAAVDFADCESSPVVSDGVVYFGLGEGGSSVCAVQADTGSLLWKIATPYPVFAPPTIAEGKLFIATGNGNFVQSAADLREMRLQILRDDGASEQELAEAHERLKPIGEVWCIDLATHAVAWKFATGDAILGAIVCGDDAIYFGSRDGRLYRISRQGELLNSYDLHEPVVSSPALGRTHVYCTTISGRLFCLDGNSLRPLWDTGLGPGAPFSSSPTIGHGHIYIGTAQQGLRCVGRPGQPEPEMWTLGERGGSADDVPVSEDLQLHWQYPSDQEPPFAVTAPLMPLDGAIYAAGIRNGQSELIKIPVQGAQATPNLAWSTRFEAHINVAPVGCGDRVCLVEGSAGSQVLSLHCVSATTGQPLWSRTLSGPNAITHELNSSTQQAGISLDSKRVYVWTGNAQLGCFDLVTGMTCWEQSVPSSPDGVASLSSQVGRGVPVIAHDLLFSVTEPLDEYSSTPKSRGRLTAQDAQTGIPLWQSELTGIPLGSPIVDGHELLIPQQGQVAVHSLIDGTFLRIQEAADRSGLRELPADQGQQILPAISVKGRLFCATDRGKILCLGAGQP